MNEEYTRKVKHYIHVNNEYPYYYSGGFKGNTLTPTGRWKIVGDSCGKFTLESVITSLIF